MNLLFIKATNFKNLKEETKINFIAQSKKQAKIKNMNFNISPMDYIHLIILPLSVKMLLVKLQH